jgi:hypothetical protein
MRAIVAAGSAPVPRDAGVVAAVAFGGSPIGVVGGGAQAARASVGRSHFMGRRAVVGSRAEQYTFISLPGLPHGF